MSYSEDTTQDWPAGEELGGGRAERPSGGEPLWIEAKDLVISFPREEGLTGVKQVALGNYRWRCFVHRFVGRLLLCLLCLQPNRH